MATRQYIGARYVPKFYTNSVDGTTQWEANVVYEPLIYVTLTNGHMYLSKKQVPATVGTPASNAEYWLDVGDYNGFIAGLQDEIDTINNVTIPAINSNIEDLEESLALGFVTPQMFGGYGDGVHDDTQAVTDALNSDAAIIVFPAGVYNVTGVKATNMKNKIIFGYGAKLNMTNTDVDNISNPYDTFVLTNMTADPTAINYNNGFLEVYGLEVDANANEAVPTQTFIAPVILPCIKLANYENVYFKDVFVHHTMTGQGIDVNCAKYAKFENCKAENIGWAGFNYISLVPSTSYEWDALGTRCVIGGTTFGLNEKAEFEGCKTNHIAGCSFYGINSKVLSIEKCEVKDNVGYCCEDSFLGSITARNNQTYVRNIVGNKYEESGSIYSLSFGGNGTEKVVANIIDNVCEKIFGNRAHSKITSRGLLTFYDTGANTLITANIKNNVFDFASSFVADGTPTYGGMSLLAIGDYTLENNKFMQNNSTECPQMVGIRSTNRVVFKDNYVDGYFDESIIGSAPSAVNALVIPEIVIEDNIFNNNNAAYSSTNWQNSVVAITANASTLKNIIAKNNVVNVGHLLGISQPPEFARIQDNKCDGSSVICAASAMNILGIMTGNAQSYATPYEGNFILNAKTIVDNNIDLT